MEMLKCVLADMLTRAVADHEQLGRRHAAAGRPSQQRLCEHRAKRHRQVLSDRGLPFGRKRVGDSRDGRRDIGRVQRRKHEMAGFSRRERDFHGLGIPHFADHDHIGRLPQGGPQRGRKVRRVDPDLDLLDHASLVLVLVFDRIFDGHDVLRVAAIDLIHQRRHRGRLAGSGRTSDEHQPVMESCELLHLRRQAEFVERSVASQGAPGRSRRRGLARDED